jgi:hypothetical protein
MVVLSRRIAVALILILGSMPAWSQEASLQRGFSTVSLGMTLEAAKSALEDDPFFDYRGDPDVSFAPMRQVPVITTAGRTFVARGLFQFTDNELTIITLELNREQLDYFSVYESLVAQYGEPVSLDPRTAIWEDELTRLRLERPLVVKYLDRASFQDEVRAGEMQESLDAVARDRFLEEL